MRELPKAASAAERAASKWSQSTQEASRSSEDFSRKVRKTIADLEFERQQLARSATERARMSALRRAGVAEASAEGVAILASVKALQAQQAALGQTSVAVKAFGGVWSHIKGVIAGFGIAFIIDKLVEMGHAAFEAAAGMAELSEQVGLSAKTFQSLLFASTQNGVKQEQLETGLSKFSQKMGEAAEGSKDMIEALTKLGVKNLDTAGKLRPTEDLLVDVAKAITSIDDPARRSAAAVDFFGKAGTRMLPLLGEIAKGTNNMTDAAKDFGAVISDETIEKLDKLDDKMARNGLKSRALFAENIAMLEDWRNAFNEWAENVAKAAEQMATDAGKAITQFLDGISVEGARATASFLEAFKLMPEALGDLFANAWSFAKSASAKGINELTALVAESAPDWMGLKGTGTKLDTTLTVRGSGESISQRIKAAGDQAAADVQAQIAAQKLADLKAGPAAGSAFRATSGSREAPRTIGAGTSAVKDTGKEAENAAKKYDELLASLTQTAAAQTKMTEAAGQGQVAFEQQKATLDAQEKLLGIYGLKLGYTAEQLTKVRDLLLNIAQGKAAESFQVATTELNNQNVILEKQIELMNERPEIQAREIALIKAKQEAEKGGTAITAEMTEARRKAIEQNETLKNQAEELKKANELWMEPVKSALSSIQQTAADAFEGMLTSGKLSFEELGQVFKKTIVRMIAEFLALATVRPVMSVLVNAVSPGMAQQMGLGTGNIGGAGGGGMFGAGGLGSGVSDFLNKPLIGGSPNFGPTMEGQSFDALGSSGGLSVGGALGGLAGIGMGAFQLASGKGIGSMLGGGLGIAGGLTSMLGPLTALGSAAGPIGLGIGLLGSLLPSLLGGGTPEPPTNRSISSLNFSGGQFGQSGGSYGMDAADLGGLGTSMKSLLDAAKVNLTSSPYGLQQQQYSKGDFSNATTFVTGPGGQQMQWGQSSDPAQQQKALDTAAAHVAHQIMLEVGSGISDTMRQGLSQFGLTNLQHAFSQEELGTAIAKLNTFDEALKSFNQTSTQAGDALKAIDDQFKTLFDTAKEFNLDTKPLDAEKARLRTKVGTDFATMISRDLMDAGTLAMTDIVDERTARYKENDALKAVTGYVDQAANIEAAYQKKRLKIMEEGNQNVIDAQKQASLEIVSAVYASVSKIQDLIRELSPGGALSGLDPASQLAGLRGSADASLAQAMADPSNTNLVDRAVSDQKAFIEFNKSFTGGAGDYQRDVQSRLGALQNLQGSVVGAAMNQVSDTITHGYLAQILDAVHGDRSAMDNVLALLARYLANPDQKAAA